MEVIRMKLYDELYEAIAEGTLESVGTATDAVMKILRERGLIT